MPVKKATAVAAAKPAARLKPAPTEARVDPMLGLARYWAQELDVIDKSLRLRVGQEILMDAVSTGNLCIDWALGGGVRTVFNQVAGFEQSGKTTLTVSTFGSAIRMKVPMIGYSDAEGSLTPDYAGAVMNNTGVNRLFDDEVRRYYGTNVLEDIINQLARYIRMLPDKGYDEEIGSWCYYVPKGHVAWSKTIAALKEAGLREDKLASEGNWWAFPTPYSGPEAVWFVDSWAAAIPEAIDDLIDNPKGSGAGLAVVARALSEELPKMSGRLKRKGVALFSVNQLRNAPMQIPPVKEFGGVALMNHSMVRGIMSERAVDGIPGSFDKDPKSGKQCIEESCSGRGFDRYVFRHYRNTKNKVGRPFLDTMTRIWVADERGEPHGYDPVFDTYNYMLTTGQIRAGGSGRRKGLIINFRPSVKGAATQLEGKQLTWMEFKELIVYEHFGQTAALKELLAELGIAKAPNLRAHLFNQLRTDTGLWGEIEAMEGAEA